MTRTTSKRNLARAIATGGIALLSLSLAAGPASATPPSGGAITSAGADPIEDYLEENPDVEVADPAVLNRESAVVVGESGEVKDVVDGSDASSRSLEAAAACSYRNAMFVNYSGWQQTVDGCGVIGWDDTARWGYDWEQDIFAHNSGPSCMQGRGYYNSTATITRWYGAGCGSGGSASAYIGNRATVAKMRGYASAPPTFGYVRWR